METQRKQPFGGQIFDVGSPRFFIDSEILKHNEHLISRNNPEVTQATQVAIDGIRYTQEVCLLSLANQREQFLRDALAKHPDIAETHEYCEYPVRGAKPDDLVATIRQTIALLPKGHGDIPESELGEYLHFELRFDAYMAMGR